MVTKQPPLPLQAPAPVVQNQAQQPASQPGPLTLNEISHTTAMTPPHIGNQPITSRPTSAPTQPALRSSTNVQAQNGTLSMPQQSVPPNSRSTRALQQFLQAPHTASGPAQTVQPPIARRSPPTFNQIHPPMSHQFFRAPYQIGPRSFGGGGGMGGGRRGRTEGQCDREPEKTD